MVGLVFLSGAPDASALCSHPMTLKGDDIPSTVVIVERSKVAMVVSVFTQLVLVGSFLLLAVQVLAKSIGLITRQEKTPISIELYNTIVRYGSFAAASIPETCTIPPDGSVVVQYLANRITDTQATLFRSDVTKELIISYRGSSSPQDFLTDFTFFPVPYAGCAGCLAHVGFYKSWQSIAEDSKTALNAALKDHPDYTTVIVGHSLGGALVNLAYTELVSSGKYPQISAAYSYGEPRVGNQAYADYVDWLSGKTDAKVGNFYRVTHANDGVPQLPSQLMGFHHHRTEFWASTQEPCAATTYQCSGQEPANCNDGAGGIGINQAHIYYPGIDYATACT